MELYAALRVVSWVNSIALGLRCESDLLQASRKSGLQNEPRLSVCEACSNLWQSMKDDRACGFHLKWNDWA